MSLIDLPNEILEMIFTHFVNKDERLMRVNKLFYTHLNKKKCERFKLIKHTLFNHLVLLQNHLLSDVYSTKINKDRLTHIRPYLFNNIYNKCKFNDESKIKYLVNDILLYYSYNHAVLYFDTYFFDKNGDFSFKIFEYHHALPEFNYCIYCERNKINDFHYMTYPVVRVFKSNKIRYLNDDNLRYITSDFIKGECISLNININDDNCIEKLSLFFNILLNHKVNGRQLPSELGSNLTIYDNIPHKLFSHYVDEDDDYGGINSVWQTYMFLTKFGEL